jgi:hypothetical protein
MAETVTEPEAPDTESTTVEPTPEGRSKWKRAPPQSGPANVNAYFLIVPNAFCANVVNSARVEEGLPFKAKKSAPAGPWREIRQPA